MFDRTHLGLFGRPDLDEVRPALAAPPHTEAAARRRCLRWVGASWLGGMGGLGAGAVPPSPLERASSGADRPPALMLARNAPPKPKPVGYGVSEKLDGVRAVWDGVRLRFRGGGTVAAPVWFLAGLPTGLSLDGELWLGRGQFEALSGTVRRAQPQDSEWRKVRYMVFDGPSEPGPFEARQRRLLSHLPLAPWPPGAAGLPGVAAGFEGVTAPARPGTESPGVQVLPQLRVESPEALHTLLQLVLRAGGEGLMLHRAQALWQPGRSEDLLKFKPVEDAEAVVMAHEPGQGKYSGRLGALRVRDAAGREFSIGSGLTDAQRAAPPPVGATITYRWRGTTASGLPRFATLWRQRPAGI